MSVVADLDFMEDLKDMFPDVFFEFDSDITEDGERYFRIDWRNGPSEAEVKAFAAGFSHGWLLLHRTGGQS
jgi:hypothetical protein